MPGSGRQWDTLRRPWCLDHRRIPGLLSHFSSALDPGNKIYIAGTDPVCPNHLCTLASVRSAAQAIISENITKPAGTAFVALRFGIRIQKTTPNGSVTIGAAYKLAGAINVNNFGGAENTRCGTNSFTTADDPPKTGYICSVTTSHAGVNLWYFFATDGTARQLYSGQVPDKSYFMNTLNWDPSDIPRLAGLCCVGYLPGADAGRGTCMDRRAVEVQLYIQSTTTATPQKIGTGVTPWGQTRLIMQYSPAIMDMEHSYWLLIHADKPDRDQVSFIQSVDVWDSIRTHRCERHNCIFPKSAPTAGRTLEHGLPWLMFL
jgi:hypothetical protein